MGDRWPWCCLPWRPPAGTDDGRQRAGGRGKKTRLFVFFGARRGKDEEPSPTRSITPLSLNESISRLAAGVRSWPLAGRFTFAHGLQSAPRNHGRVDAWRDSLQAGGLVAVKRMPRWWVGSGPDDFWRRNPCTVEQPWHDLGELGELAGCGIRTRAAWRASSRTGGTCTL